MASKFGKRVRLALRALAGDAPAAAPARADDTLLLLAGRQLLAALRDSAPTAPFREVEFKVFSQFGDDGIIQHLLRNIPGLPQSFIEFGVENYRESNTRFLLINDNWRGLVMDGSAAYVEAIRAERIHWRHDLTAVAAFITRDNIDALIADNGFGGPVGILSIDIDGNDYWVWERLTAAEPVIVIAEYNAVFGRDHPISIPYDETFHRRRAHFSNLYWGCSLAALTHLAHRKGFALVGCNTAGNNAYFVRRDRLGPLKEKSAAEGFVESRYRESRDRDGRLTYLGGPARRKAIEDLPVVDVVSGRTAPLREFGA
jgi:hypothetical protein